MPVRFSRIFTYTTVLLRRLFVLVCLCVSRIYVKLFMRFSRSLVLFWDERVKFWSLYYLVQNGRMAATLAFRYNIKWRRYAFYQVSLVTKCGH